MIEPSPYTIYIYPHMYTDMYIYRQMFWFCYKLKLDSVAFLDCLAWPKVRQILQKRASLLLFSLVLWYFVKVNIDGSALKKYTNWDKLSCLSLYIFLSFWGNERRQKPNIPHLRCTVSVQKQHHVSRHFKGNAVRDLCLYTTHQGKEKTCDKKQADNATAH